MTEDSEPGLTPGTVSQELVAQALGAVPATHFQGSWAVLSLAHGVLVDGLGECWPRRSVTELALARAKLY